MSFVINFNPNLFPHIGENTVKKPYKISELSNPKTILQNINSLASNYCPDYFKSKSPLNRKSETKLFLDFDNTATHDFSCFSGISFEKSFCGTASLKNIMTIFEHKVSVSNCNKQPEIGFSPSDYPFICFAYHGHLRRYVEITVSFIDPFGREQTEKIESRRSELGPSGGDWKFVCIDLLEAIGGEENPGIIKKITLQRDKTVYVDNLQIVKSRPGEWDGELLDAISRRFSSSLPNTLKITVQQEESQSNSYLAEFHPVNCAHNYPFISFDGLDVETTKNGLLKTFRHKSWPSNSSITVEKIKVALPPLSGYLTLDYSGSSKSDADTNPERNIFKTKIPVSLSSNNAKDLQETFKSTNGITAVVEMTENLCYKKSWEITFKRPAGYYIKPKIDTTQVEGYDFQYEFKENLVEGGLKIGHNLAKVGAEWFASAHKGNQQVRVFVDGHAVVCEGYDTCNFDVDLNVTPEVFDIQFDSTSNPKLIIISGKRLLNAKVMYPPECQTTFNDENKITCIISDKFSSGNYEIIVSHDDYGLANIKEGLDRNIFINQKQAESVSPKSGSLTGGTKIKIIGQFGQISHSLSLESTTVDFLDINDQNLKVPCILSSETTPEELVCITQEHPHYRSPDGTDISSGERMKILINGIEQTGLEYFYDPVLTPFITDVRLGDGPNSESQCPKYLSEGGQTVNIEGLNFDKFGRKSKIKIFLVDQNGDIENGEKFRVFDILKATEGSIKFLTPPMKPGTYQLILHIEGKGYSAIYDIRDLPPCRSNLNYDFQLLDITPKIGSMAGGTLVKITGSGFTDNTQILIGGKECSTEACVFCHQDSSTISCRIPTQSDEIIFEPNYAVGLDFNWKNNHKETKIYVGDTLIFKWDYARNMREEAIFMSIFETESGFSDQMALSTSFNSGQRSNRGYFKFTLIKSGVLNFGTGCMRITSGRCRYQLSGQIEVLDSNKRLDNAASISAVANKNESKEFNKITINMPLDKKLIYENNFIVEKVLGDSGSKDSISEQNQQDQIKIGVSTGKLSFKGKGFTLDYSIKLASVDQINGTTNIYECLINESTITQNYMECSMQLDQTPPLGVWLKLTIASKSTYSYAFIKYPQAVMILLEPDVHTIFPGKGSLAGGTTLTLHGGGFNYYEDISVLFDLFDKCEVTSKTYTDLICVTPKYLSGYHVDKQIRDISVWGNENVDQDINKETRSLRSTRRIPFNIEKSNINKFEQDPNLTIKVIAMEFPEIIQPGDEENNFFIFHFDNIRAPNIEEYEVYIGNVPCEIAEFNQEKLSCSLITENGIPMAPYADIIIESTYGRAYFDAAKSGVIQKIPVQMRIDDVNRVAILVVSDTPGRILRYSEA